MARPSVVLFDVDGTLATCGGAGRVAMRRAFEDTVGRDDVCDFPFAGSTDRAIARRGLETSGADSSEEAIDRFLERYLEHLPGALRSAVGHRTFDGVDDALAALEARADFAVGLGTGNVERGARAKLSPLGMSERFAFGGFGCDHEDRAQLIARGFERGVRQLNGDSERPRFVVIGDTPRDIAAAHANGAECLAVTTGPYDAASLVEHGADLVCATLGAPAAIRFLLSGSA